MTSWERQAGVRTVITLDWIEETAQESPTDHSFETGWGVAEGTWETQRGLFVLKWETFETVFRRRSQTPKRS